MAGAAVSGDAELRQAHPGRIALQRASRLFGGIRSNPFLKRLPDLLVRPRERAVADSSVKKWDGRSVVVISQSTFIPSFKSFILKDFFHQIDFQKTL
jgi:hypothetical protein